MGKHFPYKVCSIQSVMEEVVLMLLVGEVRASDTT